MKIKYILSVTLGLLLCASCSNELCVAPDEDSLFGEIPEGMFEYRFTLSGITPTRLSYADVPMEQAEMVLHSAKVMLFGQATAGSIADTDPLLYIGSTPVTNNNIRFLIPKSTNFGSAVKVAAIVICNESLSNVDDLSLVAGTSTYADLKSLTNKVDAGTDIATKGLLQLGKALDCTVPGAGTNLAVTNLQLWRPFARFDVKNEGMKLLTINQLKVRNISDKYHLLTADFPADAVFTHQKDLVVSEGLNCPAGVTEPTPTMVPGVMYSFPGSIGGDDSPELLLSGLLTTATGVKELKDYVVPFVREGVKLHILENKRYTLTLTAELDSIVVNIQQAFAEWGSDDAGGDDYDIDLDKIPTVAKIGAGLTLHHVSADGNITYTGTSEQKVYNFSLENVLQGYTVEAEVDGTPMEITEVNSYGAIKHYQLTLTDAVAITAFEATVNITVKDEKARQVLAMIINQPISGNAPIIYPGTNLKAVKVGKIFWAPVDVGATRLTEMGYLYQYGKPNKSYVSNVWNAYYYAKSTELIDLVSCNIEEMREQRIGDICQVGTDDRSIKVWFKDTPENREIYKREFSDKWAQPSDGLSSPCPVGWRIPTLDEWQKLLTPAVINSQKFTKASPNGKIRLKIDNKQNITFVLSGYYEGRGGPSMNNAAAVYTSITCYPYRLSDYEYELTQAYSFSITGDGYDVEIVQGGEHVKSLSTVSVLPVRCVKNVN